MNEVGRMRSLCASSCLPKIPQTHFRFSLNNNKRIIHSYTTKRKYERWAQMKCKYNMRAECGLWEWHTLERPPTYYRMRCGSINLEILFSREPYANPNGIHSSDARSETGSSQANWIKIFARTICIWNFCSHLTFTSCGLFISPAFLFICLCFCTIRIRTLCAHKKPIHDALLLSPLKIETAQRARVEKRRKVLITLSVLSRLACDSNTRTAYAANLFIRCRVLMASVVPTSKPSAGQEREYFFSVFFFRFEYFNEFVFCWQWVLIKIHGVWIWMAHNFQAFFSLSFSAFHLPFCVRPLHITCNIHWRFVTFSDSVRMKKKYISIKLEITDCPVCRPPPFAWSVRRYWAQFNFLRPRRSTAGK